MSLNVGVVGFGKLGLLHSGVVNSVPGSKLTAIADTSSTTLSFLKSKMPEVSVYTDYKKMIGNESLDAVWIATPTGSHIPIAMDFVERGVPIFIEKPLGLSPEQTKPLVDLLKKKPTVNMVGYMGRYTDSFVKAKELLSTGMLGRLQMFKSSMYIGQLFRQGKGWRYDKMKSGGGVLMTQNAHLVDKLLWFFGDLNFVSAHTTKLYSTEVEDSAHVYFSFKNGLTGFLDSSWSARHYRTIQMNISVQGENGTLDVNDDKVQICLESQAGALPKGWTTLNKPDLYQGVSFDIGGTQYTRQAEEFFSAISHGSPITSTVETAYKTQCAIASAYESAGRNGAPVSLGEV